MIATKLPLAALAILTFTTPLFVVGLHGFLSRPTPSRVCFVLGMILQSIGCAASIYFTYNETNHAAYLVSIINTTLAPLFTSAVFVTSFHRLQKTVGVTKTHLNHVAPVLGMFQAYPVTCFFLAFFCLTMFHRPLESTGGTQLLRQLEYEKLAVGYLQLAYTAELLSAVVSILGLVYFRLVRYSMGSISNLKQGRVSIGLVIANAAVLIGLGSKSYSLYTKGSESIMLIGSGGVRDPIVALLFMISFLSLLHLDEMSFWQTEDSTLDFSTQSCIEKNQGEMSPKVYTRQRHRRSAPPAPPVTPFVFPRNVES